MTQESHILSFIYLFFLHHCLHVRHYIHHPTLKGILWGYLDYSRSKEFFDKEQPSILSSRENLFEWPLKSAYPMPINLGNLVPQEWRYLESSNLALAPFYFSHKCIIKIEPGV